ncbi:MAG: methionyl-tRNA formyltransferase [Alistipes sp.]|nr:methionyl-tRNA formyltransferase [Alistipes sp.]
MSGKDLRIVFMGTPEFAVASLKRLVEEGYNIVAVVTTPDKPAGRGQKIHESDVKVAARELGLPILQPEKLKSEEFVEAMRALQPDLGIVIAFRMLPEVIWAMPKYGTFNLHASLLPQYRGAAPINWAIINGETETGITTFLLNHEIDKGAIVGQRKMPILEEDNIGTMYDKLMVEGCDLVVETVEKIAAQDFTPIEQMHIDESTLNPAPKIFKEDCKIDWNWDGKRIVNFVRGLSPYPAAWTPLYLNGEEKGSAKIFEVKFVSKSVDGRAGKIISDGKEYIAVCCADGMIEINSMQMAGKKRMSNRDLLLGFRSIEDYTCM